MNLSSLSIRRPVLTIVMAIVIVLFGLIGMNYLGVREYPAIDPPVISVTTNYQGANAEVIESQITEPLEESISGIAGIETLKSTTRQGRSTIRVEFGIEDDLEAAVNDVREKVSQAMERLPDDADPPVVSKSDADDFPIVFLNINSPKRDILELTDIADDVKERVQTISDVSEVHIWGEKMYSMRLWINPTKLASHGLTPLDVKQALAKENVELPSGRVEGSNIELTVRTMGRLQTEEEFNNLIIAEREDRVIKLEDVGYAELGPVNQRTVLKRDGEPMVGVVLIPQPGANHISITEEFYDRLEDIKKDFPDDLEYNIGFDDTKYVQRSINEVEQTILVAFGLVLLVIFLFLRDWRTTLIPVFAIPISLIGSFFIMYVADFSINVLTLLGIVLAIGIVVDDAIVMMENIYKRIEEGKPSREAGEQGAREIFFAIVSTTVAVAAVFLPVIFLQGFTGRLFREFGIVIAGSVIISSFVALTLTPMLSSRLLKPHQHNRFYDKTEPFFRWLTERYSSLLGRFLQHRWWGFVITGLSIGLILLLGLTLPRELAPIEDRSNVRMFATGPQGATFEYMDRYMDKLIRLVRKEVPEKKAIISVTSPGFGASTSINSGFMRVMLVTPGKRQRTQQQIAKKLTAQVNQLVGARAFVTQEQTISSGGLQGLPVQYVLQAPSFDPLKKMLPQFVEKARQQPEFQFIDVNLKFNKPELQLGIKREKARKMGVSTRDIAQTLQLTLSGQRFDYFTMKGEQYQVIGQVPRRSRDEPLDLQSLYVRNNQDRLVQLDNLVTTHETSTPPQLFRFNRYVSATVSAGLAPGYKMGDGIAAMNRVAKETLPESFSTALDGPSKDYQESSSNLFYAFVLAMVLIYLVLAAQFESFRDPFIIMFTFPLCLAGALLALWYFNQSLNIFSQIGMIMLLGLVTKNGILIVEFANQRKRQGLDLMEAIRDASVARFRPILMTSFTTIFGYLPIALALGAGAESRMSMGIAVVGGLIVATVLTLFVVPAMYSYFSPALEPSQVAETQRSGESESSHQNPGV